MKKVFTIIILFITANLYSENLMAYNMWKDKKWNYVIMLDEKWVMKMKEANQMGMDNFFIPEGYTLNNAPAGIMAYIGVGYDSLQDFIDDDMEKFVSENSEYQYSRIDKEINNEDNEVALYKLFKNNNPVIQYIGYFGNNSDFHFALALQLFEPNETYLEDFYTSMENSRILDFLYSTEK